jgi:hypothetical protein
MDVHTEISYPGATVADVFALALDPGFRGAVCAATMAADHEVDVRPGDDGSTVVTVTRTLPSTMPDVVRRLVGGRVGIVQVETWQPDDGSGRRRADLTVQVVGQPASMRGTLLVAGVRDGAVETVRGEVKVSLPFIGARFEAELARGIVAAAQ